MRGAKRRRQDALYPYMLPVKVINLSLTIVLRATSSLALPLSTEKCLLGSDLRLINRSAFTEDGEGNRLSYRRHQREREVGTRLRLLRGQA